MSYVVLLCFLHFLLAFSLISHFIPFIIYRYSLSLPLFPISLHCMRFLFSLLLSSEPYALQCPVSPSFISSSHCFWFIISSALPSSESLPGQRPRRALLRRKEEKQQERGYQRRDHYNHQTPRPECMLMNLMLSLLILISTEVKRTFRDVEKRVVKASFLSNFMHFPGTSPAGDTEARPHYRCTGRQHVASASGEAS